MIDIVKMLDDIKESFKEITNQYTIAKPTVIVKRYKILKEGDNVDV